MAINDWRLHATRAVALNPSVLGCEEARELLAEKLHHVIAFKFTVHQNVNADFLLKADRLLCFCFQERIIVLALAFAGPVLGPRRSYLRSLGKRSNCGCG